MAVEKPAEVSVHNTEQEKNLIEILEHQLNLQKLFPVHRLDKETSGIQLFTLNKADANLIAKEFQSGSVKKIYTGILRGQILPSSGKWTNPLSDKAEGRKNPAGMSRDRIPCETHFKVIKNSKYFSLCEFQLITGRQHQIRKHSALFKHPLVGDSRYGDPKYNQKIAQIYKSDRMFLHCCQIEVARRVIKSNIPAIFDQLISANS